jgi:two-component sensor histidine kinase
MDGCGRAVYDEQGRPLRLHGIGIDITERKRSEEHCELLVGELAHRVKNTLAIVQSLASQTLRPHADRDRFELRGPDMRVSANAAVSLSMAIHELATNAVNYGALSRAEGRVTIEWSLSSDAESEYLALEWVERGGPPVIAPSRRGFGSRLIEQLAREFGGEVALAFDPAGVRARIVLSLGSQVERDPRSAEPA